MYPCSLFKLELDALLTVKPIMDSLKKAGAQKVRDEIIDIMLGKQDAPEGIDLYHTKIAVQNGMCVANLSVLINSCSYSEQCLDALCTLVQYRKNILKREKKEPKRATKVPRLMTGSDFGLEEDATPDVILPKVKELLRVYGHII